MGLSRRQFIVGAAGAGLILLSHPLPRIIPAWGSSLAFGATTATKYVSNRTSTGGNGSLANPYAASEIWANMVAGDEFVFLNGIYRGANCMIDSLAHGGGGKAGNSEAFITIRAENDGQVLIDGQFARAPIRLSNNDFFIIQGFNACNAFGSAVVSLTNIGGACTWIQLKRICAWDCTITENRHVFTIAYGTNLLVEDCAGWGGGRKIFELFNGGSGTSGGYGGGGATMRRCWGEWNKFGSTRFGPNRTFAINYAYTNVIAENLIGTWDTEKGFSSNDPYDIFGLDEGNGSNPAIRYVKLLGSLAYVRQNQQVAPRYLMLFPGFLGEIEILDTMACIEPGAAHQGIRPFGAGSPTYSGVNIIRNCTSVNNGTKSSIAAGWSVTNFSDGQSGKLDVSSLVRYVNGVKTSEPLLPWPMNQRIIDARIQSGRSAVDVTATVQRVYGVGAGDNQPPDVPTGLRSF